MRKIIYVDMDGVLCDYQSAFEEAIQLNPKIAFPQSQFDFYRKLKPIQNAIESVKLLLQKDSFEIYILTAPSIYNPMSYTEKRIWIEDYFGIEMVEKLIISPNKSLLKGDYLIDDSKEGRGQENFEGELIHFGSEPFPNWKMILSYFDQMC
ncbi:hypothetical protein ACE193_01310 [Bernardetia sp. OM2101]|uniref:5' nucleotidase, NT5C type n=1 Tax=Bernardetia sp. OM2101 TaxID=3344876 RepID=UPI0035D0968F